MTFGPERAQGPLKTWPRTGGPEYPDGPLRFAEGPKDIEGAGREAFWDQTVAERRAAVSAMVADRGVDLTRHVLAYWPALAERRDFAKGWLAELERVRHHDREKSIGPRK